MITLLLALQLFAFPVTSAYAEQVKNNVVVSVTYTAERPTSVCTYTYGLDDTDTQGPPLDTHCLAPTNAVGDFDTWTNERIDMVNFKVVVKYPSGKTDVLFLSTKIAT